jgi:hypothetical protein
MKPRQWSNLMLLILLCIHAVLYDVLHAAGHAIPPPGASALLAGAMLDQGPDMNQINPGNATCDMKKAVRGSKPPRSLLSSCICWRSVCPNLRLCEVSPYSLKRWQGTCDML